jgi:hypothetical protein
LSLLLELILLLYIVAVRSVTLRHARTTGKDTFIKRRR